ncbi:MAG: hypothetical protein ACRYFK_01940 [Janthinobacterium lividum]
MDLAIYCPHCDWEPDAAARWYCTCGHAWHTFDTGGICPRCQHRWPDTQCLSCAAWSPHVDWYHDHGGLVAQLVEAALPAAQPRP